MSRRGSCQSNTSGHIEFGYIVEGAARLVDPDGTAHALTMGDTGRREVNRFVKQIYFISRTA